MAEAFPNPPSEQPPYYEAPPAPEIPSGAQSYPQPAKKTTNVWLIVLIVLLVLCCCCAAFGLFMWNWGGDWFIDLFNDMGITY